MCSRPKRTRKRRSEATTTRLPGAAEAVEGDTVSFLLVTHTHTHKKKKTPAFPRVTFLVTLTGQVAFQGTAQTPEQRVGAVRGGNGGNGSGGGGGSGGSGGGGGRGSSNGVDYEDDSSKFSEDSDEFHETTSTRLSVCKLFFF